MRASERLALAPARAAFPVANASRSRPPGCGGGALRSVTLMGSSESKRNQVVQHEDPGRADHHRRIDGASYPRSAAARAQAEMAAGQSDHAAEHDALHEA